MRVWWLLRCDTLTSQVGAVVWGRRLPHGGLIGQAMRVKAWCAGGFFVDGLCLAALLGIVQGSDHLFLVCRVFSPVDALVKLLDPALGVCVGEGGVAVAISAQGELGLVAYFGIPLVGNIFFAFGGVLGIFGCLVGLLLSFDNIWVGGQRGVDNAGGNVIHPTSVFGGMGVFDPVFSARQCLSVLSFQRFALLTCLGFDAFEINHPRVARLTF